MGCLPINYRTYITDSPNRNNNRSIWALNLVTLGYHSYNDTAKNLISDFNLLVLSKHFEKNLYWKNIKQNGFPKWLACGFPHAAVHTPAGTDLTIYDFSVSSPEYNYTGYILNSARFQVNGSIFTQGESLGRWFTPGWVGPIYQSISPHHNRTALYPDLYRLLAATNMILFYRPTKNTPEIFGVRACVNTPHAVLVGNPNITMLGKSFHITCNNCILTINSGLPKNQATFLIIHQPPHRLLPVSLVNGLMTQAYIYCKNLMH